MRPLPEPILIDTTKRRYVQKEVIYNAHLFSSLADAAYQSFSIIKWKLEIDEPKDIKEGNFVYFDDCLTTQGFLIKTNEKNIIVVFRGTDTAAVRDIFEDWTRTDFNIILSSFLKNEEKEEKLIDGKVHQGFLQGLNNIWKINDLKILNEELIKQKKKIWFVGHSLGAALATLAAAKWTNTFGAGNIGGIYTFGSPKCGNASFAKFYEEKLKLSELTFRFVNHQDIVPAFPITEPSLKKTIAFGIGYSIYSLFSRISTKTGEVAYNKFNSIISTDDCHYQHVGNVYYLDENGDISRETPTSFTRLRPKNLNPLRLSKLVFDHDYKEYVIKIAQYMKNKPEDYIYKDILAEPYELPHEEKCVVM